MTKQSESFPHRSLERALFVLGIGCSMFFDGIVLHQLLQWHHLGSQLHPPNTVRNLQWNTLLDGLFHGAAWIVTIWGIFLLWRAVSRNTTAVASPRVIVGAFIAGWGAFNIVENILNHFMLQVHHVREGTPYTLTYDVSFMILFGFVPTVLGIWLLRRGRGQVLHSSHS